MENRMIRWSYLFPRLVLLTILLAVVWFGFNPITRWSVERALRPIGAKSEFESAKLSLWDTEFHLHDAKLTFDTASDEEVISVDDVKFRLDRDALMQKQLVVKSAELSGLRIHAERFPSNDAAAAEDWQIADYQVQQWLQMVSSRLTGNPVEHSETAQVCERRYPMWEHEYSTWENRVAVLEKRLNELRSRAKDLDQTNILRNAKLLQQTSDDILFIRDEIQRLPLELKTLNEKLQADYVAIDNAKQRDIEKFKALGQLEQIPPETVSQFLLAKAEQKRVMEFLAWVRWARNSLPDDSQFDPKCQRGVDVRFPGIEESPEVTVTRLALSGEVFWADRSFPFEGSMRNVSTEPRLMASPTYLDVQSGEKIPVTMHACLDRTSDEPYDQVIVRCLKVSLPAAALGSIDRFGARLAPSVANVISKLEVRGEQINGTIKVARPLIELEAEFSPEVANLPWANELAAAVENVDSLDVDIVLTGTLESPNWKIHSDIGKKIATNLHNSAVRSLETRQQHLQLSLEKYSQAQLQQLTTNANARARKMVDQLNAADAEVTLIARNVSKHFGVSDRIRSATRPVLEMLK
jgi:uncharacterized protein (TIGR03545 family)